MLLKVTSTSETIVRIHHLNCISTCPLGGAWMDGETGGLRGRLACHCLLVETSTQLVPIDTGFDPQDVRHIVLTPLDFDHTGGLDDFPRATVHLMREEREAAWSGRAR